MKGRWILIWIVIACVSFIIGAGFNRFFARISLAKEVNLEQVTVKGEKTFTAQILIKYKDGRIDSINLKPRTTVLIPLAPKPEREQ